MANTEVGSAYVSIMPSMKGFQASVGKEVDGAKAAFGKLGSAAASAAKVALTGMVAVKGAVLAVGGAALASYADYEQLTGGVDKLFGSASDQLQKYALEAYRTSGMSANRYMEQATSFSASLIQSLAGDTAKAAGYADLAMRTMSDNVNVFGSSMEDVQNAFQGFAKQNYTMLDNLKLGYGGTQAEMKRLIKDANKLPGVMRDGADLTIDSYADVIEAIARVQQAHGIMGTTAKEAAQTVSGSIGMMKAAWENWLTALGSDDLDLDEMTKKLVDSITTVIENVVPRAVEIMGTLGAALAEEMPGVAKHIGISLLNALPPEVGNALTSAIALWEAEDAISDKVHVVVAFMKAKLMELLPAAFGDAGTAAAETLSGALDAVDSVVSSVSGGFDMFAQAVRDLVMPAVEELQPIIDRLFQAIVEAEPWLTLVAQVIGVVLASAISVAIQIFGMLVQGLTTVIETVTSVYESISGFVEGAVQFFTVDVPNALQAMLDWFSQLPGNIAAFLSGVLSGVASWAAGMFDQAVAAGSNFLNGVKNKFGEVVSWFTGLPGRILDALGNVGSILIDAGRSIIDGLWSGLKSAWNNVSSWLGDITSMIPQLKGPLPVDAKLLVTNGEAIMGGLLTGLGEGWGDVESYLSSRTGRIPSALAADGVAGARGAVLGRGGNVSNNIYIDGAKLDASPQIEQAISMLVGALAQQYDMGIA